jgi:hypothetical protein
MGERETNLILSFPNHDLLAFLSAPTGRVLLSDPETICTVFVQELLLSAIMLASVDIPIPRPLCEAVLLLSWPEAQVSQPGDSRTVGDRLQWESKDRELYRVSRDSSEVTSEYMGDGDRPTQTTSLIQDMNLEESRRSMRSSVDSCSGLQ